MSTKTVWISDSVWRSIPQELRAELIDTLGSRDQVRYMYAGNVESNLRARGEHELAGRFLEDLHYLPYPLRDR